jgi:ATP-dependent helicase/nuclease subunit A
MSKSWRSSPVVLDLVNRVFRGIEDNPVLAEDAGVRGVAVRWARGFQDHVAGRPELPGHVVVESGPMGETARETEQARLALAARRVVDLQRAIPGATIGILTRRNQTVARLIALLREMGVEASEEGGCRWRTRHRWWPCWRFSGWRSTPATGSRGTLWPAPPSGPWWG